MKIEKLPNGTLVLQESWPLLRASCAIGGCLLPLTLCVAASLDGSFGWTKIMGSALGAVLLFSIAAIVDDRRFVFDPSLRTLTWEQRSWIRSRGGQLPFSQIQDVVVTFSRERDLDSNRAYDQYRAVLVTSAGQIPLTGTSSINRQESDNLADAVLAIISAPGDSRARGSEIDRLSAAGQIIDAIALVRAQKGLGLAEAKMLVEEIRQKKK